MSDDTGKIDDAYEEFRRMDIPLLIEIMDILFGHPIFEQGSLLRAVAPN
jgi:hypothetical protein